VREAPGSPIDRSITGKTQAAVAPSSSVRKAQEPRNARRGCPHEGPEVGELERAVAGEDVAQRALDERVSAHDEIAREPAAGEERQGGQEVAPAAQPWLAEQEEAERARFEDEAKRPSIASVCPTTPPANREKRARLVPNWNSIGMPVTTPTAKFKPKIRIQSRAPPFQRSPPARRPSVFMTTMSRARPIVSWGNR
jgi:hypothetical protein